ncbi:ELWxxDGT repeat protein [Hyalangium rubrum]|uniref:ELWxxDGT repeat protein n=1 Tax=Hyalangium rubrum TaxID=3103134 RepID=A0ABU5H012_9BACT|nr:ELWxxDGT repeat protein [Hyalangium sp. s54d21]MDY7226774.1 ELWxxDGT repeat protein [Hyalangium sp. s54d21]
MASQDTLPLSEVAEEPAAEPRNVRLPGARSVPGTARRVKAIFAPSDMPAWMAESPESLVAFRGKLYFAVNRGLGRQSQELWMSDGTETGTLAVKTFAPHLSPFGTWNSVGELTVAGDRLFFQVGDATHGRELWASDGTSAGTLRVKDISPGAEDSFLSGFTATGSTLLFFRYIPATQTEAERNELWRSDGTEAGTVLVRDLGPEFSVSSMRALVGNTLFFVGSDNAHGSELWKSDGTEAGTVRVRDIQPGPDSAYPYELRAVGQHVFFTAEDASHGRELWKSDGTEAGTVLVEDLNPGPENGGQRLLGAVGGYLYFTTPAPAEQALRLSRLKLDGATQSKLVKTIPNPYAGQPDADPYITTYAVTGEKLFFGMAISTPGPAPRDVQLWGTDGTAVGTRLLVRPLSLSDEFQSSLFAVEDFILFSALGPGSEGLELWMSDGAAESRPLQDISPGASSSYPTGFTRVGDSVFFVANDDTDANQLWVLPVRRLEQRAELRPVGAQ